MPRNVIYDTFNNADIAQLSKDAYIPKIVALNPSPVVNNLNFLIKTDEILEKISKGTINQKKASLAAILSLIKYYKKTSPGLNKAKLVYQKELTNINSKINSESNMLSDDKRKNWVTKEEVDKKMRSLRRKYNKIIKKEPKEITDEQYKSLLDYVVLSLYTLTPPRREQDYFMMFVDSDKLNSFDKENKKFIFREYKDKRALGTQIIDIPPKLYDIIENYVNINIERFKGENDDEALKFLIKPSGAFVLRGDIRRILTDIFNRPTGTTHFRRLYATDTYKPVVDKMKSDAEKMGTSVDQLNRHYIKKNVE
jgi:hypothetical protein